MGWLNKSFDEAHSDSRRRFLKMCAGTAAAAAAGAMSKSAFGTSTITTHERSLSIYNIHTDESLKTAYWAEGNYIPESLSEINFLLRDFRTGEVKAIDQNLLDLLHLVCQRLDASKPIHLISGPVSHHEFLASQIPPRRGKA